MGTWGKHLALAVLCMSLGVTVPAARAAPLPPDLVGLEQQMAQLQVNSERFSFQLELAAGDAFGQGVPFVLLIAGAGEVSDSPPQASLTASFLGLSGVQSRLIGNTLYRYRPQAAKIDGGRPWVRSQRKPKGEAPGLDPSGLLESDVGGTLGTFSQLIQQLNGAQSIQESGPATVDDQRVMEFDATLDPTPFLEKLRQRPKKPRHPLKSLFEGPQTETEKAPPKPSPPPTFKLELFIASNGLPVRSRFTFAGENAILAVRVDTLAINIPVHVAAPPAQQTIDEAQLKRIEQRQATQALRQGLRECRRLHLRGHRAAICRRAAHNNSPGTSSEGSLL